jgi:hypothetical protein
MMQEDWEGFDFLRKNFLKKKKKKKFLKQKLLEMQSWRRKVFLVF